MKKRISLLLLVFSVIFALSANAEGFLPLGECPMNQREATNVIALDPYENEIYGNAVEITAEEWYATVPYNAEGNSLIPFNGSVWNNGPTAYNDGLRMELITGFHELFGDDQSWAAYTDINGNSILSELPGGWQRTWNYYTHYNFGFFTEGAEEMYMEEYASAFPANFNLAESVITNAFTGQTYRIDSVCISCIDNNANIYFYIPQLINGTLSEKFYKATLKQSAVVTVYYNGNKIGFDQVPVIESGRTLVPLRAIFEKIGASVDWNPDTRTVTATKGDISISLTVDSTTAIKNGKTVTLDVPAKIIGGRTLVPVRFISDCFGVGVEWDGVMQRVLLTEGAHVSEPEKETEIPVEKFVEMTEGWWYAKNSEYHSCEILNIANNCLLTGVYPGEYDRDAMIKKVQTDENGVYKLNITYPETYMYDELYPEESAVCTITVSGNTEITLTFSYDNIDYTCTYTYAGKTFEEVVEKCDELLGY